MAYLSSLREAKTFWANRKTYMAFHEPDLPEKIVNYDNDLQIRIEREQRQKKLPYLTANIPTHSNNSSRSQPKHKSFV